MSVEWLEEKWRHYQRDHRHYRLDIIPEYATLTQYGKTITRAGRTQKTVVKYLRTRPLPQLYTVWYVDAMGVTHMNGEPFLKEWDAEQARRGKTG